MSKWFAIVTQSIISVVVTVAVVSHSMGSLAGNRVRRRLRRVRGDAGMSTAEYAVGTIAACAFAAVLYQVVTGDSIVSALQDLIDSALSTLS